MEDYLKKLLKEEKEHREKQNNYECLQTCLSIMNIIESKSENNKFEIISKLFLYSNQSNYVKLSLIYSLIKNKSFINNEITKGKYYKLLIDSFSKGKDKEFQTEINQIKKLYEKSNSNNFLEIDKYISDFVPKMPYKHNNTLDNISGGESSIMKLNFNTDLVGNNDKSKGQTSYEVMISESNEDIHDTISKINIDNDKKISQMKYLLRKYKPDNQLPLIIISVSVKMNSNQFMNGLNNTFEKYNYRNICTIKDTDKDNIRVYEYRSKNCISNLFSKISCKNKNKNQFIVYTNLKRDENNFDTGINSFLSDTYERKITIKTVKGNKESAIKALIQILKNYCLNIDKIQLIKQSKCFLKYNLDETFKKIINEQKSKIYNKLCSSISNKDGNEQILNRRVNQKIIENTLVEKTNNNAVRYYEMYKVFSKNEYELGKTISEFVEKFKNEYKMENIEKINENDIDTKSAMMKIVNILEVSTNILNSTFNNNEEISIENDASFFADASENFILNKIYPILYNIYDMKYKKDNDIYLQKKKEINSKMSIDEIFAKMEIKQKLRGNDKQPFKYVIDIINKITFEKSLKRKFETITQASLELRNCVLDYTNCKFELESMDDELPIIIFISTQVKVDNFIAELNMLDDYIKCSMRDNLVQNKMVTNLLSSLMYLSKSWNSKTGSFD